MNNTLDALDNEILRGIIDKIGKAQDLIGAAGVTAGNTTLAQKLFGLSELIATYTDEIYDTIDDREAPIHETYHGTPYPRRRDRLR